MSKLKKKNYSILIKKLKIKIKNKQKKNIFFQTKPFSLSILSKRWASVTGCGVIEVGHFGCENIIVVLNGVLGMG